MRNVRRGLERKHEQNAQRLIRDTRTFGERVADYFKNPIAVAITITMFAVSVFFIPALTDLIFVMGIIFFMISMTRRSILPFRIPQSAKVKDYNDPLPGGFKPRMSRGIYFFGNDLKTKEELWFSNEDMRTHVLIFGSTGSGKTEALISMSYNSLLQGSGFIYVDGKGDNSLYAKIFSMARSMGREDDLLLINFMTGARDIIGPQKQRISNTMNPFCSGSSSMLSQLVVSLMDSSGQSGDGDMWKGRAINFVEALMKVLVAMRDAGHILLDANSVRNYFSLDRLEAMVLDKVFIRDGQEPIALESFPDVIIEPLCNYVFNLPGYNKERKGKQVSQVLEQHGYITMQLVRVFSSLADTYGHILRVNLAEVDLKDVVLNRRILVVLLPALEKSPDELANLGKIIIASLRSMMASGLGDEVEGEYHELITRKPTNAPTPFLCILDEYGYYAVQGFAVVPAQARSLGFSVVFAGQDLPAFQKASKEEAASIGANTNIKICMKLEDPMETWEFFSKTAGEAYVTHVSGFQSDTRGVMNNYMDNRGAQLEKRARIDLMDLKDQREGEMHIFFKSTIIRASTFYANPKPAKFMRLNQFLKVLGPEDVELKQFMDNLTAFEENAKKDDLFPAELEADSEITRLVEAINAEPEKAPIERAVDALLAQKEAAASLPEISMDAPPLPDDQINIFMPMRLSDYLEEILLVTERDLFTRPLLDYGPTQEQSAYIERVLGRSEQYATNVAAEIIRDMEMATHYPPIVLDLPSGEEMALVVNDVIDHITHKKLESSSKDDTSKE